MKISKILTVLISIFCLCAATSTHAQVPEYKFDPDWPKLPLPNKWWMQNIMGLYVDHDDNVWVLNLPSGLSGTEDYATLSPPTAECCVAPPTVIAFNSAGNVIRSWDTMEGHGLMVDSEGYVWIGSNTVRKFTNDGELVAEVERVPEDPAPEGKYAPNTQAVVGRIEEIRADEAAREIYFTDTGPSPRLLVFDMDTLEFKRGWGAYGKALSEISMETGVQYDPGSPPAQDFLGHLTLGLSNDGMVYVADRPSNRIQVFTKEGEFLKEFFLATSTLHRGSTGGVAFSADPEQRHLIVPDFQNNTVWILNRQDGTVVGRVGSAGNYGGQFHGLHMADVDSRGNIYTGEVFDQRVQRFLLEN